MRRRLPSPEEAAEILARKRTRPAIRPSPPVGKRLAPLVKVLDERFGKSPSGLAARWKEIVGETLARHTEPVKIVKPSRPGQPHILELKVEGPAAAIVQHQAPDILARAALVLGDVAIGKLRIVQGPIRRTADTSAQPKRRRRGPLDAAAEAELAGGLSSLDEGPLKTALEKLGREVLRGR